MRADVIGEGAHRDHPPEILYNDGTARRFVQAIKEKGLLPQNRQYVHLSVDTETVLQVGNRRDSQPTLLIVQALEAWTQGVKFYRGNNKVWYITNYKNILNFIE